MIRSIRLLFCVLAVLFCANAIVTPQNNVHNESAKSTKQSVALTPHVATYEISLMKQTKEIAYASGKLELRVHETGDGWASNQLTDITLYTHGGREAKTKVSVSYWEAKDGQSFRFMAKFGNRKEIVSGSAKRDPNSGKITVKYSSPEAKNLELDAMILFPIQHLQHLIKQAKAKQISDDSIVFDGTNDQHETMDINTIIGDATPPSQDTKSQINGKNLQSFPLVMSVFLKPDQSSSDYYITQKMLENGIVEHMVLNFSGDVDPDRTSYQLVAKLKTLKVLGSNPVSAGN